jgi:hypothetical protein
MPFLGHFVRIAKLVRPFDLVQLACDSVHRKVSDTRYGCQHSTWPGRETRSRHYMMITSTRLLPNRAPGEPLKGPKLMACLLTRWLMVWEGLAKQVRADEPVVLDAETLVWHLIPGKQHVRVPGRAPGRGVPDTE